MTFIRMRAFSRAPAAPLTVLAAFVLLLVTPELATAASGVDITATEGAEFTKQVANINCTFGSATINWGDGQSSAGQGTYNGFSWDISGTHTYAQEGTYHGTVTYTDDCTTDGTLNFTATVGDAPISAQGRDVGTPGGRQFTAVVSHVTDANPFASASDFAAQIDWGDGSQSAGQVSAAPGGGFDVKGTHTYQHPGQATVNVTVTDVGGSTANSSSTANISEEGALVAKLTVNPLHPCQQSSILVTNYGSTPVSPSGGASYYVLKFANLNGDGKDSIATWVGIELHHIWFPSVVSPSDWSSLPVGSEVRVQRPPATVTLTAHDSVGNAVSADPQTITWANPDDVYVVAVGDANIPGSQPVDARYYYLKRKSPGPCGSRFLPLGSAFAKLTAAPVALAGESSLTTTVKCRRGPDCIGTLYAVEPSRRRSAHQASSARRKRPLLGYIAKKTFVIRGGSKRRVKLHLTKGGRRLAHKGHLKRVRLLLVMRGDKPHKRTVKVRRVP